MKSNVVKKATVKTINAQNEMYKKPRRISNMCKDGMESRLTKMVQLRAKFENDINNAHVKLQKGNSKTGVSCWTVSLIPVVDCINCKECKGLCYDLRNDCWLPGVQKDRARNSAIRRKDIGRFWNEINQQIKDNFVEQLRLNVGGDLTYDDFIYVNQLGESNPRTDILFFTKSYEAINDYIEKHGMFTKNVHPIMSAWENVEMKNPYNLPESHLLYSDGRTTAPEFGAYFCGGNCTECHFNNEGCWTLKEGEHVIFPAH